jgi:hypothetical protein
MYTPQIPQKTPHGTPGPASNRLQSATSVDLCQLHQFHELHEFQSPLSANHTTPTVIAQIAQKI